MQLIDNLIKKPILLLLIGAVCISFSPIFINLANVAPDAAGFYRMLFGGVAILIIMLIRRERLLPYTSSYKYFILSAVVISIDFFMWHRSIPLIGPGLATIIGNFQVFFTAAIAAIFLNIPLTFRLVISMIGAMSGVLMITGMDVGLLSYEYKIGILLSIGTAIFYSFYLLSLKKIVSIQHGLSGMGIMMIISMTTAIIMCVMTIVGHESLVIPDMKSLGALLGVGIMGQVIGWVLISIALEKVSAPIAGLILLLQPALAFVWDVLIFGRSAQIFEIIGLFVILSAIYIGSMSKDRKKG